MDKGDDGEPDENNGDDRESDEEKRNDGESDEDSDEHTQSDDDLRHKGHKKVLTRIDPTQQKVSEQLLAANKFRDQVLYRDGVIELTREMLYDAFKRKGRITMEVHEFLIFFSSTKLIIILIELYINTLDYVCMVFFSQRRNNSNAWP